MRILLADDDPNMLGVLALALQRGGFEVRCAGNGLKAWQTYQAERPDLAVLDIAMPGLSGIEVVKRIAALSNPSPVILLTGGDHDVAAALDAGADDYIRKPCSARELLARVRAVMRRGGLALPSSQGGAIGRFCLDVTSHTVSIDERPISVTPTEFAILRVLIEHRGQVVHLAEMVQRVWARPVADDLVRVAMYRLRRKIEVEPKEPRYLHTISGVGFMLRDGGD